MDRQTALLLLENIYDEKQAARYLQISNSQFHVLLENHAIAPIKDHLFFKGDLDEYMKRSYSLNHRNVKEAVFYYTMMTFTHDDEAECESLLHILEVEKQFRLSDPFYNNMHIVSNYLHISEVTFYKEYMKMEAYFMDLPLETVILRKEDLDYPIMLREEKDSPYFIFMIGKKKLLEKKSICITGSEHPREEEIKKAIYLTRYFLKEDYTIMTGIERGVSTYILLELMKQNQSGVVVLSSSFLDIFPKENKQLYEYFAMNGLVITPFIYSNYHAKQISGRSQILASLAQSGILLGGKDHSELVSIGEKLRRQNKPLYLPSSLKKSYMNYPETLVQLGARYFSTISELESYLKLSQLAPHD